MRKNISKKVNEMKMNQRDGIESYRVASDVAGGMIYQAFSTVLAKDYGFFRVYWFNEGRKNPIGDDEKLLESYRKGNFYDEEVAECFIQDEIEMLRAYLLRRYSWWLRTRKYTSPKIRNILVMNEVGEFSFTSPKKALRFVDLSSQEGYNLPFKVRGYGQLI